MSKLHQVNDPELEKRMKEAGMRSIKDMLETNGPYDAHTGVVDFETFESWLSMKLREYITTMSLMKLDGEEDDDLFEWVVAHMATFHEVMANFRQAKKAHFND